MKGRFSRIFEIFNKRNTEYYQEAFDRLEKENKTTFNFAAALAPVMWLIFRKMYGWAALAILVYGGAQMVLQVLYPKNYLISSIFFIVCLFCFGFFGNTIYHKTVKSRIAKGYAEMEDYNSTDPVWSFVVIGMLSPMLVGILSGVLIGMGVRSESAFALLTLSTNLLLIAIPWAMDYKKFRARESIESIEVTEESLNKYLEKINPKRVANAVGIFLSLSALCLLLFGLSIKAVIHAANNQSTKVATEVGETLNNSGSPKTVADFLLDKKPDNSGSRPSIAE